MPTKPNKKVELAERRQRVAALSIQGRSQQSIAEHLGVSQTSICFDLQRVRKDWRDSGIRDFDILREVELRKLEHLEREAWAAWERSQKPLQSAVVSGDGGAARARKTVKNQHGDPWFLEQVHRCIAQRRALLGLDAPTVIATDGPSARDLEDSPEVIAAAHQLRIQLLEEPDYLDYLRHRVTQKDELADAANTADNVIDLPRLGD